MSDVIARYRVHPAAISPMPRIPYVSLQRHRRLQSRRRQFGREQRRFWDALQGSQLAVEFYRAVLWDGMMFDFFSPEARLGVCVDDTPSPPRALSQDVRCVTITTQDVNARREAVVEYVQGLVTARVGVIPWPSHIKAVTYDPHTNITTEIPYEAA